MLLGAAFPVSNVRAMHEDFFFSFFFFTYLSSLLRKVYTNSMIGLRHVWALNMSVVHGEKSKCISLGKARFP